jgi:spore maturation protein CgeB
VQGEHYHSNANPPVALLQQLRARGSRVVLVWLDKKISRNTPDYYAVADVNVVLDGNDFELPNAWPSFTPKNPRFFRDAGSPRDIDVSLVGEVRYLAQRKAMVDRLRTETRVAVTLCGTSAADTKRTLSVAEYAELYQRSRISLAMTKDTVRQLKGRVFEIVHCGALLCCDVNHHVQSYFTPGRDYVEYHDYEHLVDRLQYFLRHEEERAAVAAAGHRRATHFYSNDIFWRSLLSRCGASASAWNQGE